MNWTCAFQLLVETWLLYCYLLLLLDWTINWAIYENLARTASCYRIHHRFHRLLSGKVLIFLLCKVGLTTVVISLWLMAKQYWICWKSLYYHMAPYRRLIYWHENNCTAETLFSVPLLIPVIIKGVSSDTSVSPARDRICLYLSLFNQHLRWQLRYFYCYRYHRWRCQSWISMVCQRQWCSGRVNLYDFNPYKRGQCALRDVLESKRDQPCHFFHDHDNGESRFSAFGFDSGDRHYNLCGQLRYFHGDSCQWWKHSFLSVAVERRQYIRSYRKYLYVHWH